MIVPQSRFLFWFAAVALPFSVAGAAYGEAVAAALTAIGGLAVVAAFDLARGMGSLEGIAIELPQLLRCSKDRDGVLEVRIRNSSQKEKRLRLGLAFPPQIRSAAEDIHVLLPSGNEWSRVEWAITPLRRGRYHVERAHLESISPMGFWALRATAPARAELRVYPNLLSERKNLAALFLNRGAFGVHTQRQVGKGREFEKLRDYIPGDSFEDIHWKVTAKRGRPVTKVFQIERTQEVYVVIDASRLAARPASGRPRKSAAETAADEASPRAVAEDRPPALERFVTAALVLGLAAERQGDLFGLCVFSDKIERFVRARNGRAHYGVCRDAIYTLEPRGTTPDFDEVAAFLRAKLRRRALLLFLTALDDPVLSENFVKVAGLLSAQHLVVANMLKPPGADPLFARPDVSSVDDLYQRLGGHFQWQSLRELEAVLRRRGVRFSLLEDERLSVQLVSQYLSIKQRQAL